MKGSFDFDLPHVFVAVMTNFDQAIADKSISISDAARFSGTDRRTIQRWLHNGKIKKANDGTVLLSDVLGQKGRRTVGRPPKGLANGEHVLYWRVAGTPDWERASVYFEERGLMRFRRMVTTLAHRWVAEGKGAVLVKALIESLAEAEELERKKRDGEVWGAQTRKTLAKYPASE